MSTIYRDCTRCPLALVGRRTAAKYSSHTVLNRPQATDLVPLTWSKTFRDLHAASSQRGGQGFKSPQLHPVSGATRGPSAISARDRRHSTKMGA